MSVEDDYTLERNDPFCAAPEMAAHWLLGASWKRFMVLGDGLAQEVGETLPGYVNLPWPRRVAEQLERLQPGLIYLNLGKRDLSAAKVRAQQLKRALAFEPDLTAVSCGGVDILRRFFDADAVETELTRIVATLRSTNSDVIIIGAFDITHACHISEDAKNSLRERLHVLAERARSVALNLGAIHVNLTAHPVSINESVYAATGWSLNSRGHAIVATEIMRRLAVHLGNEID